MLIECNSKCASACSPTPLHLFYFLYNLFVFSLNLGSPIVPTSLYITQPAVDALYMCKPRAKTDTR